MKFLFIATTLVLTWSFMVISSYSSTRMTPSVCNSNYEIEVIDYLLPNYKLICSKFNIDET